MVVTEELKHNMTLDEGMLKRFTGGMGVVVEDRKFGAGEWYSFVWQAGFLLVFNEGDCPRFDAGDEAFLGRMVVVPMRSKFVETSTRDEPYTFQMDREIRKKFPTWRSALADILLERYDPNALADGDIPASMREWRWAIGAGANPVAEWLEEKVAATGNLDEVVVLSDLRQMYQQVQHGRDEFKARLFDRLASGYLVHMGAVKSQKTEQVTMRSGEVKVTKGVFRGAAYRDIFPHDP